MNVNTLDTIESVMLTKNRKDLDGVKLDVRKTFDDVFVISPYEELEKFTMAQGNISDYPYRYLRKVKFPSHIFKYFIPTLEEILKNYNPYKIIVLEIYQTIDFNKLFVMLVKYPYKYYFLSKEDSIINELKELDFDQLGKIINYQDIIRSITSNNILANTFLIKE